MHISSRRPAPSSPSSPIAAPTPTPATASGVASLAADLGQALGHVVDTTLRATRRTIGRPLLLGGSLLALVFSQKVLSFFTQFPSFIQLGLDIVGIGIKP